MQFFPNERQSMNLTLCIHLVPMQITGKGLKNEKKKERKKDHPFLHKN
jgi:hypothetical protein